MWGLIIFVIIIFICIAFMIVWELKNPGNSVNTAYKQISNWVIWIFILLIIGVVFALLDFQFFAELLIGSVVFAYLVLICCLYSLESKDKNYLLPIIIFYLILSTTIMYNLIKPGNFFNLPHKKLTLN